MTSDRKPPETEEECDFAALFEASLKSGHAERPQVGQTVKAKLLHMGPEWAFLDIGAKGEAVMNAGELRDEAGKPLFAVGDVVECRVARVRDDGIVVSRVLQKGQGRELLEQAKDLGLPVEGAVRVVVKGGLEVDVSGARAFCPASQIDLRFVEDVSAYVGQKLTFRVLEYREGGRNVVLSRRALLEEEQHKRAEETRKRLAVGTVFRGPVTSLREYGAFVDLGGIEGLLHVSEIGHARLQRAADVLAVGQEVEVQVIKMEGDKVSLSMKSLQRDPWEDAAQDFAEGTRHKGMVVRLQAYGAFVELRPGIEGLLHVSNLGDPRIRDPRQALSEGQEVEVAVISLDPAQRRIGLALSQAVEGAEPPRPGQVLHGKVERVESYGVFVRLPGPPSHGRPPRGLVPLEEIGPSRGDLRREFPIGAEIAVMMLEPDAQGRIRLSRKAALDAEERGEAAELMRQQAQPQGFGTLGDLLSGGGGKKKR
jgi:small subunit ribosomal protein S1